MAVSSAGLAASGNQAQAVSWMVSHLTMAKAKVATSSCSLGPRRRPGLECVHKNHSARLEL
eukprot:5434421-Pyramimonas_sp.AAC.1